MSDQWEIDFASFPRGELIMSLDRREVFRSFATELRVSEGKRQGGVALRLADLGTVPDDQLAGIRPLLKADCVVEEARGVVWVRLTSSGHRLKLCPSGALAEKAIRSFDGQTDLRAIADRVSSETGRDVVLTFAYTRGLFLHLVSRGLCVPA